MTGKVVITAAFTGKRSARPDAIRWQPAARRDGPPLLRFIGDRYIADEAIT